MSCQPPHPEKPKRITAQLGSTIIAKLKEYLQVNWAVVILEGMARQVANLKGKKALSLSTYLYLFYQEEDLLTRAEKLQYRTEQSCIWLRMVKQEPGEE